MKFSESFRTISHDTDAVGVVRAAALFRYMQETAFYHLKTVKPSFDDLKSEGKAYLLSRSITKIYEKIYHPETIRFETWASTACAGISFDRCYRAYIGDRLVMESEGVWVLYNFRERKIERVAGNLENYELFDSLGFELPRRLKMPDGDDPIEVGARTYEYADIDVNGHVNNAIYPDMLSNFIPEVRTGDAHIASIYINYKNECRLDDTVRVFRCGGDGEWYFRTVKADGNTNVEARITTAG
ncbi:MAG: thioesterase [Clostridia bacterium]|nr:thioesterase [Clostridia bacterium]